MIVSESVIVRVTGYSDVTILVSVTVVGITVVETDVLRDTDTVVTVVNWVAVVVSVSVAVAVAVIVVGTAMF